MTYRSPRLWLGAAGALLAAATVSATPAMAATQSTCVYNTSNKNLVVTDNSGANQLELGTDKAGVIRIADGPEAFVICRAPNLGTVARVTNTERIAVFAAPAQVAGGYTVNQSNGRFAPGATPEADGSSEVEISLNTTGTPAQLTVIGTPQRDVISVGTGGRVNFAYDLDADIEPQTKPVRVIASAGVGNDELDSNGGGMFSLPADGPVDLRGDAGNDTLVGAGADNILRGGSDDDRIFAVNGHSDGLTGGTGFDRATTDKTENIPFGDIEQISVAAPF